MHFVQKDRSFKNSQEFKKEIKSNYGLMPSSDLYRKIINYQIRTYGKQLEKNAQRDWIKYFGLKSNKERKNGINRIGERRKQRSFIERVENGKK